MFRTISAIAIDGVIIIEGQVGHKIVVIVVEDYDPFYKAHSRKRGVQTAKAFLGTRKKLLSTGTEAYLFTYGNMKRVGESYLGGKFGCRKDFEWMQDSITSVLEGMDVCRFEASGIVFNDEVRVGNLSCVIAIPNPRYPMHGEGVALRGYAFIVEKKHVVVLDRRNDGGSREVLRSSIWYDKDMSLLEVHAVEDTISYLSKLA